MTERLSHGVCVGYGNGVWVCAARGEQTRGDVCGVWICDISIYGVCIPCAWCVCVMYVTQVHML